GVGCSSDRDDREAEQRAVGAARCDRVRAGDTDAKSDSGGPDRRGDRGGDAGGGGALGRGAVRREDPGACSVGRAGFVASSGYESGQGAREGGRRGDVIALVTGGTGM